MNNCIFKISNARYEESKADSTECVGKVSKTGKIIKAKVVKPKVVKSKVELTTEELKVCIDFVKDYDLTAYETPAAIVNLEDYERLVKHLEPSRIKCIELIDSTKIHFKVEEDTRRDVLRLDVERIIRDLYDEHAIIATISEIKNIAKLLKIKL